MIERPNVVFDEKRHTYTLDGEKLYGVSTVSKIGEDAWGPASWWGWRVGYEGANQWYHESSRRDSSPSDEELRAILKERKLTPVAKRNRRGREGTWTHDVFEALAQTGELPPLARFPAPVRGHVASFCGWYLEYRPEFVATEVQVVSVKHGFAGRYDIRCLIGERLLCLVDLKTSKDVYPASHFVQLAGYELASVEMGFPPTDAQFVLNTRADGGRARFRRSCAKPEHFLAYLAAEKAKREIEKEA